MLYLFLKALVWLIPIWIIGKKKYCSWDQFKWSLREISKKKDWLTFGFLMFGDKMFWGLCSGFLYWGFIFGRSGLGVHFRTFGVRTFGVPFSDVRGFHFRTFGVRGSFSDVRGSDVRGAFFGRSGFGFHFRTFGVGGSEFNGTRSIFGHSGFLCSGFNPEHPKIKNTKNPECLKKKLNPQRPKPRTSETPNPEPRR